MIILDSTSKSIVVVLAGAVATAQPIFTVSYADTDGTLFTEMANDGLLNGATEVELVAAPAAGHRRLVRTITIFNDDTADVTFTLSIKNGANVRKAIKKTLIPGESYVFPEAAQFLKDHGTLLGLGDDDHGQYYNAARHTKAVHDALGIDADLLDGSHAAAFAPVAKGVDNGNSHDHVGGDGAQVDHGGLAGLADDDHSQYHNDARGDARYTQRSNNLTDVGNAATAFGNIKQAATEAATGVVELATDAEAKAGTDTSRIITPANLKAVLDMRAPNRNAIINGSMDIWQRGTSFVAAANIYTADRFSLGTTGTTAVVTVTQDTDVPTPAQAGRLFNYSLKVDVTTADATISAPDFLRVQHVLEGYNFAGFVGQTGTLSFWVKSHKTGTYCIALRNSGVDRSYIAEYTVNVADTWEKKAITIPFNYSGGTWNYTNLAGIYITWTLAAGSNHHTTAGAWQNGNYLGTSNQVNFADSVDNNFWLTGVQLELGSVATPFENRSIQNELELCQRYYEKSYDLTTAPGSTATGGCVAFLDPTTQSYHHVLYKVRKRTAASVTFYSTATGASGQYRDITAAVDIGMNAGQEPGEAGFDAYYQAASAPSHLKFFQFAADAEL